MLPASFRATLPVESTPNEAVPPASLAPITVSSETKRAIRPLAEVERQAILEAIEYCDGNIPQAARLLGVSPSTIYRKMQSWQASGVMSNNK